MNTKICKVCGLDKDVSCFHKHSQVKDGFDPRCKSCKQDNYNINKLNVIKRSSAYYLRNKEKVLETRKKWYYANREEAIQKSTTWAKNNPESMRRRSREGARKRRAMKRNINEHYKDERLTKIVFCNMCVNCYSTNRLEIDHHYPLSKGFALTTDNAVLLCKSCNTSKGDKSPVEFYTKEKLIQIEWVLCKL